ncbi:hypothetical protein U9M48_003225 [Paspalum notatum var. saurae]|uniref:CCHC-type domain-containing protein n=1 Tax=Paspalum notatum var. saurae TaxID=547442 RepID=A0AAQ3PIS2_PASNO
MLAAKMDMLLKKLEDNPETAPVQALDTHMTCEVCGNMGHSRSSCPETRPEDANFIGKEQEKTTKTEENDDPETSTGAAKEKPPPKTLPHEFYDSTVLPFPQRNKKAAADEQYSKFVEVPTYAKYLKDILNNKKPLAIGGNCAYDRGV